MLMKVSSDDGYDKRGGAPRIAANSRPSALMWSAWVSYIPVSSFLFAYYEGKIAALLVAAWFALELSLSAIVMFSKCPRCNRLFHTATFGGNTWARHCIHCGLPLGKS
jgi:hypothetical protein